MRTLAWVGEGAPRMEVAHVESVDPLVAEGTQLGATYELRYRLEPEVLKLAVVNGASADVELGDADFFDLGFSPLFNSLPVLRDGLLIAGEPRDYVMRWVDVPSLGVRVSEQRYTPLGDGVVRYSSATFQADILFDADGFVVEYPGLGRSV
jgi:uncharacterized protein